MGTRVEIALVREHAQVHAVLQHLVQRLLAKMPSRFGQTVLLLHLLDHLRGRPCASVGLEDPVHSFRFLRVDQQLALFDTVAQRHNATHPQPLAFGGGNLVADAFAGHFAFELSKRQQHVEHQASVGGRGIDLLGDGAEADRVLVKDLHHLGKVGQGAREAVDLVDHHYVNTPGLDVCHQAFEAGAFHVAAGEAGVFVGVLNGHPAFCALAHHKGQACFALGIDGVELLVQAFIRGHTAVDGAAFDGHFSHAATMFFTPKNAGPDQCVPVMFLAIADRLR